MSVMGTITVHDPLGIHARPAATLAKELARMPVKLRLVLDSRSADPKSVIQLLALGASVGSKLTVEAEGDEAAVTEAMEVLKRYL